MGSYISLGFVYRNNKEISDSLKQLLALIIEKQSTIRYKVCYDLSEDHWLERTINHLSEDDINYLTHYFYSHIECKTAFLGFNDLYANITIYKNEIYYGFLIDLFEDYFKISVLDLEELLIDFVDENYSKLKFDYAFCEHDGEIELSPDEVMEEEGDYSLLFLTDYKGRLQIKKGDHLLDGLTMR